MEILDLTGEHVMQQATVVLRPVLEGVDPNDVWREQMAEHSHKLASSAGLEYWYELHYDDGITRSFTTYFTKAGTVLGRDIIDSESARHPQGTKFELALYTREAAQRKMELDTMLDELQNPTISGMRQLSLNADPSAYQSLHAKNVIGLWVK